MAGSRDPQLQKILSVIEYGTLSVEETRKRVEALIQSEIEKPQELADMRLIDACEDLLWELGTEGCVPFDSRMEKNLTAVRARLNPRAARFARPVARVAAVVAALFVFSLVGESVFHREGLEMQSTPDEQQFVVRGYEIDPALIGKSIAERAEAEPLYTQDVGQVVDYLGFEPYLPDVDQGKWNTELYYASVAPIFIDLRITYQQTLDETNKISFHTYYFSNPKDAYAAFEQNGKGDTLKIAGRQAYVTENMDNTSVFYYNQNCVYLVTGTVEEDEILQFTEKMIEGLEL